MAKERYQLADILAVAKVHPFYNPDSVYPADTETIEKTRESIDRELNPVLQEQPLLTKKAL